jgi:hypothetical protein
MLLFYRENDTGARATKRRRSYAGGFVAAALGMGGAAGFAAVAAAGFAVAGFAVAGFAAGFPVAAARAALASGEL